MESLKRLLSFFQRLLKSDDHLDPELVQRYDDLRQIAVEREMKLKKVLQGLEQSSDFYHFIQEAFQGLFRELNAIEKRFQTSPHYSLLDEIEGWIEKATIWITFFQKEKNLETIMSVVSDYIVERSLQSVTKDLQLIHQYEHLVTSRFDEEVRKMARERLFPHIDQLEKLQQKPRHLPIKRLAHWKRTIEQKRARIVNRALHEIDTLNSSPS